MKLIGSSDWHLWKKPPVSRIDKMYFLHGISKVQQIIDIANEHNAVVCVAGDLYDAIDVTPLMINVLSNVLRTVDNEIVSVAGQHDMNNRQLDDACPYTTLLNLGCMTHLNNRPYYGFYGISYTDNGRLPIPNNPKALLIHKTITEDKPPFFLKNALSAKIVMEKYRKFPVIISGDYHVPFVKYNKDKSQVLVNCGVLMRKEHTLMDYEPGVFLIDTDTLDVARIPLRVLPKEEVFSMASVNSKSVMDIDSMDQGMTKVISLLKDTKARPSYTNIIQALAVEQDFSTYDMDIINDILRVAHAR